MKEKKNRICWGAGPPVKGALYCFGELSPLKPTAALLILMKTIYNPLKIIIKSSYFA
jgi:hypothetical protein